MTSLLFLLVAYVVALPPRFANPIREVLKKHNSTSPWTVFVDGVMAPGMYAYTTGDRERVYVDLNRFANAPNSFINTIHHEAHHLLGENHGDNPSDPNNLMNYRLTIDSDGNVVEDARVWQ